MQGGRGTEALVKMTRREGKQRPSASVGGRWLPTARVVSRRTVGARDATRVVDVDRVRPWSDQTATEEINQQVSE